MSNPFATEEAWKVDGGGYLPIGDHKCTVLAIDGTGTSSGNYPQVEIEVGNAAGESSTDKIVTLRKTVGKIGQFIEAIGLEIPSEEEQTWDGDQFRLSPEYLNQALGKEVGVVVRGEPGRTDPTKTFSVIKGYVPVDKIDSDLTPNADQTGIGQTDPSTVADDDIPF
jgi:hypothetical protein